MKYSAYGVCLESDIPLTGLPEASGNEPVKIRLRFKSGPDAGETGGGAYTENWFRGRRVLARSGREYDFNVEGVGTFRIVRDQGLILFRPTPQASDEVLRYWLLRYMIPIYLACDGSGMLFHGSAVKIGNGVAAFFAKSFGGKSTLANYLEQQGHPLITDDDLRVDENEVFMAAPSIPFVRAYRAQEDIGKRVERFDSRPMPLRKIYLLELSDAPASITAVSATEASRVLLQHHRYRLTERMAEHFRFSARLAAGVPVARLVVPRCLARLPDVHRVLLEDMGEYA